MKSTHKFNKKWKWISIGTTFGVVAIGTLSLGIALSVQNKSLQTSSSYFIGSNSLSTMQQNLNKYGFGNFDTDAINWSPSTWNSFATTYDMGTYPNSSSSIYNSSQFNTYRINLNSLNDFKNTNLLTSAKQNLLTLLGNKKLSLYYYTLDNASFFSSSINLFTDGVINALKTASHNYANLILEPETTNTFTQVMDNQNCELGTSLWSPDYNNVSAWIGYLFSQNNGWITGNLWPCLWDLLAGANPSPNENDPRAQFINPINGNLLPNTQLGKNSYMNATTFIEQLSWTNERRAAMGLGNLPPWAVSLYYTLYQNFGNIISWNTPYGWWQLQYNNNDWSQTLQYVIQDWTAQYSGSGVDITINGTPYESISSWVQYENDSENVLSITINSNISYDNDAGLVPFIAWIDALVPTLPFYSDGNNTTTYPVLTQKGVYPLLNPANSFVNSTYFINVSGNSYGDSDPFTYYIPKNVVSSSNNYSYFSPVLGPTGLYKFAAGLFSGFLDYAPYNYDSINNTYTSLNNGKINVSNLKNGKTNVSVSSKQIMKAIDATNFELLSFNSNFQGAHYDSDGSINHGDTIITSGNDKNANILFISNPALIYPNVGSNTFLTQAQFDSLPSSIKNETWSTYADYQSYMENHAITSSDSNLKNAENKAQAYQFVINPNVKWVNESGNSEYGLSPEDFNNLLAWLAATMSNYSYGSNGLPLSPIQGNSYMLQEMGIAGNNFNLGVGSGFFQTEEYLQNMSTIPVSQNSSDDTFTYFLSPQIISSSQVKNGWNYGVTSSSGANSPKPLSYFMSMLSYRGSFFDPIPSSQPAFSGLSGQYSSWNNLTIGELTQDFMGTDKSSNVYLISKELGKYSSNPNSSNFISLYNKLNSNPAYVSLMANETIDGSSALNFLYGSGIDPSTGNPSMQSDILFNGGYYATSNSFTISTLTTKKYPGFFDSQTYTDGNTTYYFLGPSSQKLNTVKYQWSGNITKEEELILYTSNSISCDPNVTAEQLADIKLKDDQAIYYRNITNITSTNTVYFNAQIYQLTYVKNIDNNSNSYPVPYNDDTNDEEPLIVIDPNDDSSSFSYTIPDTKTVNGITYYATGGFPYISDSANVLYTNSNYKSGLLKSLVNSDWTEVVGTVLDPFIYGTTGAEIRQDMETLINWTAIANNADYPLPQTLLAQSVVPYGNYQGSFTYETPITNESVNSDNSNSENYTTVTVSNFFQYASAVSGMGLIGTPLYFTYPQTYVYYAYNNLSNSGDSLSINMPLYKNTTLSKENNGNYGYYGYTTYQWDMINAINRLNTLNLAK